ncbi:MAG: hypothetical protein LBV26_06955 [Bacteroidales bacterium]|jgi:hypothetical protein|nr:hypothetical protein [Bacteroidales bacterium]
MKKTFLASVMFLGATLSFAQTTPNGIMVFNNEKTIGRMTGTQKEIKATEYTFPGRIYDAHIDNVSNTATVQLRTLNDNGKRMENFGDIVHYDLNGRTVKWTKYISYVTSKIRYSGSTIIFSKGGNSYRLNPENGQDVWRAKNDIYFVDSSSASIGIGYKFELGNKVYGHTLEGIDLNNGKRIWQRELNREYGWNDALPVNDSTWMILSGGLHTVNVHDGSGWSYNEITGVKDYTGSIAATAAGFALGAASVALFGSGTFFYSTGYSLISDLVSNVYSDSTGYYLASRDKVSRIRKNEGTAAWWRGLPDGYPSKSYLFAKADTLFMVNFGFAFRGDKLISYGTPFFAAFSKETGAQLFFSTINIEKNPILDFRIKNDHILLLFKDRLMKYSLRDGSQILEKPVSSDQAGELMEFAKTGIYIDAAGSHLANLVLSDTSKHYIVASSGRILIFDTDLNITGDVDTGRLYDELLKLNSYTFVTRDNQSFIIDANNKKVAEIDVAPKAVNVAGNKLYFFRENILFEIDIAGLTGQ